MLWGLREALRRWLPALRTRRFDAAAGGRRWQGVQTFGQVNAEIGAAAGPVRRRASYYARNNPWIGNGVAAIVSGAVGAGIKPQSQHPDPAVRAALHARWQAWTDEADADGVTDAYGLQALAVRSMVETGECFAHLLLTPDGLRVRLLDADMVPIDYTRELGEGRRTIQGVEFAADGSRAAYWLHRVRPEVPSFSTEPREPGGLEAMVGLRTLRRLPGYRAYRPVCPLVVALQAIRASANLSCQHARRRGRSRTAMRVKLVVIAAVVLATGPASAAVLCAKKSGVVVLRAACKRKEKTLDVAQFGAVGAKGDPGMPGMQGPRGVGPLVTCLPDSVLVGTTCVDKYEESVWQIDLSNKSLVMKVQQGEVTAADLTAGGATQLGCTGDPFNHAAYSVNFRSDGTWTPIFGSSPPSPGVYAVSIPGVLPSACTTWFQANQACQLSGKRLLTNREWQGAAASTPDAGGADDGATTCATHSPNPVAAGARPNCKSAWGAFDMVGNVYEWVADWSDRQPHCTDWKSTVGISADGDLSCFGGAGGPGGAADSNSLPGALTRGGAWGIAAAAGVFAVDAGPIPSESRPDLGFRCAR